MLLFFDCEKLLQLSQFGRKFISFIDRIIKMMKIFFKQSELDQLFSTFEDIKLKPSKKLKTQKIKENIKNTQIQISYSVKIQIQNNSNSNLNISTLKKVKMQNQQNKVDVQELTFDQLPCVDDLQNSGMLIATHIKGHSWTDSFNCITELRKINKYHPEFVPTIIENFSQTILELLSTGKTLLVKNIFRLIKELFDAGQQVNVQKAVIVFLPILIKKASTDIGYMKTSAQEVLTTFCCNCGYESSLTITAEHCLDKNASVSELSLKLLQALIQKVGEGVMQLSQHTLMILMKCFSSLIDGKRQNLSKQSLDICMFICQSIGGQNYLKLMQYCLKPEEQQSMGSAMETHRTGKEKPLAIKQAIRHRQTDRFNHGFFNKTDNNFIPLGERQINSDNNYNHNQYYQQQSYY